MTKFKDFLAEQLNNPELRAEYDALKEEFELAQARIDSSKLQNKDKLMGGNRLHSFCRQKE